MVDADVLLGKIAVIRRCLLRIQDMVRRDPSLDEMDAQDVVTLNLQRAIQACIDMAAHVVREEELGITTTHAEYFTLLQRANIISLEVESTMRRMIGFRNVAVHEYQELKSDILRDITVNKLGDFERFYLPLIERYVKNPT